MNKLILAAPLALATLLAACGQPETIVSNGPADPTKAEIAAAPPVKLPPAVLASKTYRCQPGNAVLYVDWFNDNTATLKPKKDADPIALAGTPLAGGGYTVEGSATAATVSITGPSGKLSCAG